MQLRTEADYEVIC